MRPRAGVPGIEIPALPPGRVSRRGQKERSSCLATIDALSDCAQACAADADVDLSEQDLAEMVRCVRLCLDCTDVCTATLGVVSRQTAYDPTITRPLLEACVATCHSCGDECTHHAPRYEHCRVCEQACRRCEQACRELLGALK